MTKQLTKPTIGVGVAGIGFIRAAPRAGLCRNAIWAVGLLESTKENTE
jgi:hypothetical protein